MCVTWKIIMPSKSRGVATTRHNSGCVIFRQARGRSTLGTRLPHFYAFCYCTRMRRMYFVRGVIPCTTVLHLVCSCTRHLYTLGNEPVAPPWGFLGFPETTQNWRSRYDLNSPDRFITSSARTYALSKRPATHH